MKQKSVNFSESFGFISNIEKIQCDENDFYWIYFVFNFISAKILAPSADFGASSASLNGVRVRNCVLFLWLFGALFKRKKEEETNN